MRLLLLVGFIILHGVGVNSQSQDGNPFPKPLEMGMVLLHNYEGRIWILDPFTGERQDYVDLVVEGQAGNLAPDLSTQSLFFTDVPGYGAIHLGIGWLKRLDLTTGQTEILFEKRNLLFADMFPGRNYSLVSYYPADATRIYSSLPVLKCLFEVLTQKCTDLPDLGGNSGWPIILSEELLLSANGFSGDPSFIVNVKTGERIELPRRMPFQLTGAAINPNIPDEIIGVQGDTCVGFVKIDLSTMETEEFAPQLRCVNNERESILSLSFSPDGRYLLYRHGESYSIVDYATGEVVLDLDYHIQIIHWLDNVSLIAKVQPHRGEYPEQIVRYDLMTGQQELLTSFSEPLFLTIVR